MLGVPGVWNFVCTAWNSCPSNASPLPSFVLWRLAVRFLGWKWLQRKISCSPDSRSGFRWLPPMERCAAAQRAVLGLVDARPKLRRASQALSLGWAVRGATDYPWWDTVSSESCDADFNIFLEILEIFSFKLPRMGFGLVIVWLLVFKSIFYSV